MSFCYSQYSIKKVFAIISYLFNDYSSLKSDLSELVKLRLPNARSESIVVIVQGFGLLALSIAWISESIWFIAWNFQLDYA